MAQCVQKTDIRHIIKFRIEQDDRTSFCARWRKLVTSESLAGGYHSRRKVKPPRQLVGSYFECSHMQCHHGRMGTFIVHRTAPATVLLPLRATERMNHGRESRWMRVQTLVELAMTIHITGICTGATGTSLQRELPPRAETQCAERLPQTVVPAVGVDAVPPPSSSSSSNSNALSLQAVAENPLPTLPEIIRHRSSSYSRIALRNRCTCNTHVSQRKGLEERGFAYASSSSTGLGCCCFFLILTYHVVGPCRRLRFEFRTISDLQSP